MTTVRVNSIRMAESTTTSLAAAITCLVVVAGLSVPFVKQLILRLASHKQGSESPDDLYEDEDGPATVESQAAYTDFPQRVILVAASLVGLLDSLASAILTTRRPSLSLTVEQWLQFATWVGRAMLQP